MAAFTTWFEENSLGDFYIDGFFNLDVVEKLEDRLGVNLNFYTFEDKKPELYYRSGYRQVDGPVFHLVVIPMELFYDNNKAAGREPPKTISKPIIPCGALDEAFRAAINIKNVIRKRAAHCAVLKLSAFSGNGMGKSVSTVQAPSPARTSRHIVSTVVTASVGVSVTESRSSATHFQGKTRRCSLATSLSTVSRSPTILKQNQ
jgi:hypothetical protein